MSDHAHEPGTAANGGPGTGKPHLVDLDRDECLRLISPGGVGRVAFNSPEGPMILPVNYRLFGGAVVFRTATGGKLAQELSTGVEGVEFKIAFEIDRIDETTEEGWSVIVHGPAHHVSADELDSVTASGLESWAGGSREHFMRIVPTRITGRRIVHR